MSTSTWKPETGRSDILHPGATDSFRDKNLRWTPRRVAAGLFVALAVTTNRLVLHDPFNEFHRSGASTVSVAPRKRSLITLFEARQLALRVLANAKEELARDRAEEAQYFEFSWGDDNVS